MEDAIKTLATTFLKSARGKESLGDRDFKCLVKKQLGNIMADTDCNAALKEMKQGLDEDHDGKVSFAEYLHLIGYLANCCSQRKCQSNSQVAL